MSEITNFSSTGVAGNVMDLWTPIIGMDDPTMVPNVPRWLPIEARRRVRAYEVLDQLYSNVDPPKPTQEEMSPVRTGTVPYLIQVLRDLTVGGEQKIVIPGADEESGDAGLKSRQTALEDWAQRNKFYPKVQEAERMAGLLGDVFYRTRVGRTKGKKDVKVDILHPCFVFPVFDKDDEMESVALIWEEYRSIKGVDVLCVYKDEYKVSEGRVLETAGWYLYTSIPSLSDLQLDEYDKTVDGTEIRDLDIQLDRIPIFHLPNFLTASIYGESDLAFYVDLAKEMNAVDTDISAAAALVGSPQMVVAGLKGRIREGVVQGTDTETTGPGKVWNVDTNGGKAEYLDNTMMLKCLAEYYDRVEKRLFRNTRLGKLFSGETDNVRDIESAKALKTLMASLYARIAQKRTVRKSFYAELLKGVCDLFVSISAPGAASVENILLSFGNVLPSDNADDLKAVGEIWAQGKGPISAVTAVKMAARAGSGVVDFKSEAADVIKQVTPPKPTSSFSLSSAPKKK